MVFLVLFYGINFFTACIAVDGKILSYKIKNEITTIFPKETISDILLDAKMDIDNIDYIIFLGKPLSYFERLINLHMFFFPFSFFNFVNDFKDFFIEKMRIKTLAKERLGYKKDICFPEPMDAIASEISRDFHGTMIISFKSSIDLRTLGCYKKDRDSMTLVKELNYPSCVSTLYNLASCDNHATLVNMEGLVDLYEDGSFILKKRFFRYNNGAVTLKKRYRVEKKDSLFYFEEIINRMISSLSLSSDEKVLFVSDYSICDESRKRLEVKFGNLDFIYLDRIEMMNHASKYAMKAISKIG